MAMVQGVGTATGPVLVVDTMMLPRNSPVALSVPADVTIICVLQKLLSAVVVGGSWTGTLGLILRSNHGPLLKMLRSAWWHWESVTLLNTGRSDSCVC